MSRSKIISTVAVSIFLFGIYAVDCAVAGEKQKWHGASYTVKWEQIEIGDEEGHVIAIYEQKQVYFDENTGEKTPSSTFGILDLNIKTGQGIGFQNPLYHQSPLLGQLRWFCNISTR